MGFPISDGVIQLEQLRAHHAEVLAEAVAASGDEISRWFGDRFAPKSQEAIAWFIAEWEQSWDAGTKYGLIAKEARSDRCIGFGLLNCINPSHRFANLGYWIRPEATGQGYATALTKLLAEFGFEALGLIRLELVIEPQNTASQRVAEKAGAKREGLLRNRLIINGKSRDAWMYSLIQQ